MASHQSDPAEAPQPVLCTSLRDQTGSQLEKSGCNSVRTLSLIPAKTSRCPSRLSQPITSASTTSCSPFCQLVSPRGCCHPVLSSSGSSSSCGHVTTFTHLWTLGPPHGPASECLGTRLFQSSALCPRLQPGLCSCLLAHFQEASTVCLLAWTPTWVQSPATVPAPSPALTPPDHPALWTGHASSRWNSSRSLRWLCRFQQHLQLCLGTQCPKGYEVSSSHTMHHASNQETNAKAMVE